MRHYQSSKSSHKSKYRTCLRLWYWEPSCRSTEQSKLSVKLYHTDKVVRRMYGQTDGAWIKVTLRRHRATRKSYTPCLVCMTNDKLLIWNTVQSIPFSWLSVYLGLHLSHIICHYICQISYSDILFHASCQMQNNSTNYLFVHKILMV